VNLSLCKGLAQAALHFGASGNDHQARSGHVQAVHGQCVGPFTLRSGNEAVLFVFAAARHTQQARGFIQNHQMIVEVNQIQSGHGHRPCKASMRHCVLRCVGEVRLDTNILAPKLKKLSVFSESFGM
jgi:hypothetical protein